MIVKLKIEIDKTVFENKKVYSSFGSIFQGFLMDTICPSYADKLHIDGIKPYSQYLYTEKDKAYWVVTTLTNEAYDKIILPLMDKNLTCINLTHKELSVPIIDKKIIEHISYDDLIKKIYIEEEPKKYVKLKFVTPTSFKSHGEYLFYPKLSNILFSLIQKFDANALDNKLYDEEVFDEILKSIKIVSYNLKSTKFHLEKTTIPSFKGEIVISIKGNDTIKRLVNLILAYGNYSGIGIKTAIGMGGIDI